MEEQEQLASLRINAVSAVTLMHLIRVHNSSLVEEEQQAVGSEEVRRQLSESWSWRGVLAVTSAARRRGNNVIKRLVMVDC